MLHVFGDESADESKKRVFAVAGVVGTPEGWSALEAKWVGRTEGLPFHANHCDGDQGDYAETPHDENKALYRDLATLLANSGLEGHGIVIDLLAQREVFPDAPDIAYYKALLEVIDKMKTRAVSHDSGIKFIFDSRKESEYNAGMLYGMYRDSPEPKHSLFSGLSFASARENPGLQVADLMARESMKAWDNQIGPTKRAPRKSWMVLYKTGRFHIEVLGKQWFESLKLQLPKMQEDSGITVANYKVWLEAKALQHNLTNLFKFTQHDVSTTDKEHSH